MTQIELVRDGREPAGSNVSRPGARALRSRRAARGSGRSAGPILRPVEACPAPGLARRSVGRPHACALPRPDVDGATRPGPAPTPAWRLTDRGVALVLVTGLMIMVAALTVVCLTALKVTGEGYQPSASASRPR